MKVTQSSRGIQKYNAVLSNDNKSGEQSRLRDLVTRGLRGKQACNTAHSNDNKTAEESHSKMTQKIVLKRFREWFLKQAKAGLLEPRAKKELAFVHLCQKPITMQKIINYLH